MKKMLLVVVLVLGIASLASAPASEYGFITDGDWCEPSDWSIYVDSAKTTFIGNQLPFYDSASPGSVGTNVFINGTVTIDCDVEARGVLDGSGDDYLIHTAGTLKLHGYWFGEGGGGATHTMTGNAVTTTNGPWGAAMELGNYSGLATMNISGNGQFLASGGNLHIGSREGTADLNLSDNAYVTAGGLTDFTFWKNTDGSIDIADDARIVLFGHQAETLFNTGAGTGKLLLGIIAGNITANGVANPAAFNIWNDTSGNTIINVPEPATIALLGMGGLALIRRKR